MKYTKQISALFVMFLIVMTPVCFAATVNSVSVSVTDTTATIEWQTDTVSTGIVDYGKTTSGMSAAASTAGESTTHEVNLNSLEDSQYYYYTIQATDTSGTYATNYMNFTTLLSAPQNLMLEEISETYVKIEWDVVSGAQSYNVYKDGAFFDSTTQRLFETSALNYKTAYSFTVTAVDKYNRESAASNILSFTTEEQKVNFTFVQAKDVTKTTAVISWQTDRAVNATVKYGINQGSLNLSQSSSSAAITHEFTLKDLEEAKTYYYQLVSAQTTSEVMSFRTLGDETAVEIMSVGVGDVTRGTAEISWITNYETQGYVYYSLDDSFSQYYREDDEAVTHGVELDSLLSGMTYYFKIIVEDAESDIYNFTTSESLYDFLDLEEVPALYNNNIILLKGTTAENARVYVFVNRDANPYAQSMFEINGTYFEVNVTLNPYSYVDGVKGRNIIEIDSWDTNNNKAVKTYTVDVDVGSPLLTVNELPTYTNTNKINISGATEYDATVGFFIDDKSKGSIYITNESGYFNYQLDVGTSSTNHTISVEAADAAGNIATYEKIIYVDREDPHLDFYTSFAGTTHYKLFRIDGQTEPDAQITVTNYGEFSGCEDANFQTKYGECDYLANVNGPGPFQSLEALIDPTSLMVDLLSMGIGVPTSTVAGPDGNFSIILSLLPGEANQQLVGKNTLIFNVTDIAGNKYDTKKEIKYQPSCIDWTLEKTTTYPMNLYTQDMTAGNIIGSSLFELRYLGGGVPEIGKLTVKEDETGGNLVVKEGSVEIGTTESLYYMQSYGGLENSNEFITISSQTVKSTSYDKDTGKIYLYVPVTINKYTANVDELPEQFGVYLDVYMTYTDGNGDLANCHLYPALSYDIQKPESVTKWLSPTMINQSIELLDGAINVTESAIKYLTWGARATTLACGAMIAFNYVRGFEGATNVETSSGEQCNANLKSIYSVCDRILCPSIPEPCDEVSPVNGYTVNGKVYTAGQGTLEYDAQNTLNNKIETDTAIQTKYQTYQKAYPSASFSDFWTESQKSDTKKGDPTVVDLAKSIGSYDTTLTVPSKYETTYDGKKVTIQYLDVGEELASGKSAGERYIDDCQDPKSTKTIILFTGLEKEDTPGFSIGGSKASQSQSVWCSEKTKEDLGSPSAKDIPGCYNEECPQFDNVKCLFGKGYGINPAEDLFGSLQCGCITGAKGHLENLLKVMYGAKKCLQQALIGETTAGYCERLMSYFVCDILTQIFKHIFSSLSHGTGAIAGMFNQDRLDNYQDNAEDISTGLKDRYGNIVTDRMGLSTDSIVNKACLAAFTADWSVLEDALDAIVEEVPVAPIAAAQATSRPYGFDPFTGKITIAYNVYLGIVPGGDTVIKAWMECDRNYEGGEYCAESNTDKIDLVAKGKVPGQLTKDGFFDQNIMYIDQNSASWYNKLVVQLSYNLGGELKTDQIIKPITKNGDISMLDCKFSLAAGIDCSIGAEFMDLANGVGGTVQLYSNTQGTQLSPNINTYYPNNQVSALVKVMNAYPNNFYFRINTGNEFEYSAIGGTETGDYRGLQYYLLWLGDGQGTSSSSSSSSSSNLQLSEWKYDENNNQKLMKDPSGNPWGVGVVLPQQFDALEMTIYPYDIASNHQQMDGFKCAIERDSTTTYKNRYGVFIAGTFYPLTSQSELSNVCAKNDLNSTKICTEEKICVCDTKDYSSQEEVIKVNYDRLYTGNGQDEYVCISERRDVLSSKYTWADVGFIGKIYFNSYDLASQADNNIGNSFKISMLGLNPAEITTELESKSSSSTSSSSKTAKINVLADINEDNRGETKIYSNDQKPKDQEVKLQYSISKSGSTTTTIKPVVHFIEPVSIIEQDTGYVNSDNKPVPLGFTVWDDKNEILTISIGIVGYDNYQCLATWTYDEKKASDPNSALQKDSSTDGKECGLKQTIRSIGLQENKPSFFEFDLDASDNPNPNIKRVNDAYYDITIQVVDQDQNQAQPQIRRIRFGDNIPDTYDDMLVCLGTGECSSIFDDLNTETITDVEQIITTSAATSTATSTKSSTGLSSEQTELQSLTP
ncbi:MAG: fibronectin type III domain-containing protein [Candidatus Woesearchaeota archaeon]|jgi:hypothetical protein